MLYPTLGEGELAKPFGISARMVLKPVPISLATTLLQVLLFQNSDAQPRAEQV